MIKPMIAVALLSSVIACTKRDQQDSPKEAKAAVESDEAENAHSHDEEGKIVYTCSMHPEIRQSTPGKCPICFMNLTKIQLDEDDATETMETMESSSSHINPGEAIGKIKLRKSQMEHFKPSFFPVSTMKMSKNVRLLGTVLQSEDKESSIPARIPGRVEKIFIKSTGSFIQKGDPVLKIYSPQLITAGEEYLVSRRSFQESKNPEFQQLMKKSQERLELWGIRKRQYESWFRKSKVPQHITIYSPATGIVRKHNAKVGRYFKEGENFFELSDLSEVWVEMDVYEHDSAIVKIGQELSLEFSSLPGQKVHSVIDFIDPILDPKSRTLKVRTTINNPDGALKPGMIAEASLKVVFDGEPLVVPRTAIINTGKRKVVWLKMDHRKYEARLIETGFESEGYVEVTDGLMEEDEVVMDGNFLLDAQAQLFGGYSDMTSDNGTSHQH